MKNNIMHYVVTGLALCIIGYEAYAKVDNYLEHYRKKVIQEAIANNEVIRTAFIASECKALARR